MARRDRDQEADGVGREVLSFFDRGIIPTIAV